MKKLMSFFKYALLSIVSLVGFLVISGWVYIKYNEGRPEEAYVTYLRKNQVPLNLKAENTFAKVFPADFYQNRIFLLGESHGYQVPQDLDLQLTRHLHQQINCRNYLAEMDAGQAYYLNQYLVTGNEDNLKNVFRFWRTSQWGNKNFYNKIISIRQFNQTLPAHKRIRVVGIDRIQDINLNQRYLREVLNRQSAPGIAADQFSAFLQLHPDSVSPARFAQEAATLLKNLEQTDPTAIHQNNSELHHLLQNFAFLTIQNRDSVMAKNFLALEKANSWEQEPFYGLWGYSHTLQAPLTSGSRFAALLKMARPNYQLVSINLTYVNSEMMLPQGGRFSPPDGKTKIANSNGPLAFQEGIKDLTTATNHPVTLFKLKTPGSPYQTSNRLAKIKTVLGDGFIPLAGQVTTDYFQYVILVNGSKAVEPLTW